MRALAELAVRKDQRLLDLVVKFEKKATSDSDLEIQSDAHLLIGIYHHHERVLMPMREL
jgi:hypothetical protein